MQCSRFAALPASSSRSSSVKQYGSAVQTPFRIDRAASLASFLRYFILFSRWRNGAASGTVSLRFDFRDPRDFAPAFDVAFESLAECGRRLGDRLIAVHEEEVAKLARFECFDDFRMKSRH